MLLGNNVRNSKASKEMDERKVASGARTKKRHHIKYKKAPGAPKRFKSPFIFFSTEKHKEIRARLGDQAASEKTTTVAKMVAEEWKKLPPEEREIWEEKARQDKQRYELEKKMYTGPWRVAAAKKVPKDPTAPKRPMSAFLAFSNGKRAAVRKQNPTFNNGEISRLLSEMWRELPEGERAKFIEQEFALRQEYKIAMAEWRTKNEEEAKTRQKEYEEDMAKREAEEAAAVEEQMNYEENVRSVQQQQQQAAAAARAQASLAPFYGGLAGSLSGGLASGLASATAATQANYYGQAASLPEYSDGFGNGYNSLYARGNWAADAAATQASSYPYAAAMPSTTQHAVDSAMQYMQQQYGEDPAAAAAFGGGHQSSAAAFPMAAAAAAVYNQDYYPPTGGGGMYSSYALDQQQDAVAAALYGAVQQQQDLAYQAGAQQDLEYAAAAAAAGQFPPSDAAGARHYYDDPSSR